MSSPSSPQSTVPSDASPDTTGADDGGGGMQRGASYFFGFLITFVVLLLIFVGCGVVSRRRFAARRRARFEWDMEPWAERIGGDVGYVPPVLSEKTFVRAKDGSLWKDLNPLAALVVCPHNEKQISDSGSHVLSPPSHPTTWPESSQSPRSPPLYGGISIDTDLEVISRTLSSSSRTRSEPLTRITSGGSGLVRITSPTPYHRNPNVILAQHEAEQGQRPQQDQEQLQEQEQEPTSQGHGLLHYLNPTSWLRPLHRRRRRERGQVDDMERDAQGATCAEKLQEEEDEKKPKTLQVAMLIEMPSQASGTVQEGQPTAEFEIGIASIPWSDDLKQSLNVDHEHWHDPQSPSLSSD